MSVDAGAAYKAVPPTPAQRRAADPRRSVWVTANAGTGKTRVLADRVLRLLLAGAHPESILCITFTKAAAAEMAARIERDLARWSVQPDEAALRTELEELTGEPPTARTLGRARRLFAQVLDLSHGLRIMTIHALCQALLKRFPLEAGVAPHFETIDDRTSEELKAEARQIVFAERCGRDEHLRLAVERLAVMLAENTLRGAVDEMLARRHRLTAAFAAHCPQGTCGGLLARIDELLEVEAGTEPPHLIERACADGEFDVEAMLTLANTFRIGGKKQKEAAPLIVTFLDSTPHRRRDLFEDYRAVFFNKQGEPRGDIVSAAFRRDQAPDARIYDREQARLGAVQDRIRALHLSRRTAALLRLGHAVVDTYEGLKRRQALLDFDDLIEHTRVLLSTPGRKEWVLYKLDQRLDHVLVDEAQDTSPGQWAVVERLTEEFLAGAGARSGPRTLFVVGDEKQSIYSFQGADLVNFREVHRRLTNQAAAAEVGFGREALDVSFRSSRAVLELVDAVLGLDEMRGGAVAGAAVRHETSRKNAPGLVELWPLAENDGGSGDDDDAGAAEAALPWPLPDRARVADRPQRGVAVAIARTIRRWLVEGEPVEEAGRPRPLRAGDVLVLVARRGTIQEEVIRALKNAGVPVAGADRLPLGEHIAVKDLVALGRVLLLPEDDLTLASLLKSPLLGLGDDELFELAWDRGPVSLLERLRERAEAGDEPFAGAYRRLAGWMRRADFTPPFEFYAHVLGADGGRERLAARLGPDALEPVEAFLGQALAYERGHPASLEGFLHWLTLSSEQLKRDPEHARDAVRVMTVHGAKGLEAPVVLLADAGPRGGSPRDCLLWLDEHGGPIPLARPRKDGMDARCLAAVAAEERAAREEQQRLLYVALTRARDRLYVTGWKPKRGGGANAKDGEDDGGDGRCWHDTVRKALEGLPGVERFEVDLGRSFRGEALRLRRGVTGAAPVERDAATAGAATPPMPTWARSPAPEEPRAAKPLAPSRLASREMVDGDDEPGPDSPAGRAAQLRIRDGVLVHRLLQVLPGFPAADRERAGHRLLDQAAAGPDWTEETRERLLAEALAVLAHPDLADLFAPGSRAEQPLCGLIGGVPLSGQIDRLAVTPETVTFADYKTGRRPPPGVEATPVAYLRQMAAYRALLLRAYPGREVRAALVWTQGPRVDLLPDALLDAQALPHAASSGVARA